MGRRATSEPHAQRETVDLSPEEFAHLLGLAGSDAPYLATAPVRLPAAWVESWRSRLGVRELTVADLAVVLHVSERTIFRYLVPEARPRLSARAGAVAGGPHARLVSPANLVQFLRERSRLAGVVPVIRETAGQEERRGKREQELALELVGSPRPRTRG